MVRKPVNMSCRSNAHFMRSRCPSLRDIYLLPRLCKRKKPQWSQFNKSSLQKKVALVCNFMETLCKNIGRCILITSNKFFLQQISTSAHHRTLKAFSCQSLLQLTFWHYTTFSSLEKFPKTFTKMWKHIVLLWLTLHKCIPSKLPAQIIRPQNSDKLTIQPRATFKSTLCKPISTSTSVLTYKSQETRRQTYLRG